MNYFSLFNIKISFIVDKSAIKKSFFELSKQYHPDVAERKGISADEALELTAHLNKGYAILCDEDKTIEHVLSLYNLYDADEKYNLPSHFLMQVMDINEAIAEGDKDKNEIKIEVEALKNEILQQVKTILTSPKQEDYTKEELEQVKNYYYQKKYLNRILEAIK